MENKEYNKYSAVFTLLKEKSVGQNGMSKKYQSNGDKSKGMERHENVDISQLNIAYEQKKNSSYSYSFSNKRDKFPRNINLGYVFNYISDREKKI